MKAHNRLRIEEHTNRQIHPVEMSLTLHIDTEDYSKTFDTKPEFVLLVNAEDELYHTSAYNLSELSSLIKCVDVKYIYETETRSFYEVV